jgi:hypothetical protein
MRKNHTDINLIVDRSGSMSDIHDDVIGGLNTFLDEQKKLPGTVTLNAYEFDDKYDVVVENQDLSLFGSFTKKNFVPRGGTNLYDAIGRTIAARGNYFANQKEEDRPDKVILVVFTDGLHNVSGDYSKKQVFEMVRHQEEKYSWEVIFLGADMDAMAEGGKAGIASGKTMAFSKNNFELAAKSASAYAANYRGGKAGW